MTKLNPSLVSRIIASVEKASGLIVDWSYGSRTVLASVTQSARTKIEYAAGLFFQLLVLDYTDTITAIESIRINLGKGVTDTATAVDTVTRVVGYNRSVAETSTATDTVTRAAGYNRSVVEIVNAVDSRTPAPSKGNNDTTTAGDIVTTIAQYSRSVLKTADAVDTVTRTVVYNRTVSELATAQDVVSALKQDYFASLDYIEPGYVGTLS